MSWVYYLSVSRKEKETRIWRINVMFCLPQYLVMLHPIRHATLLRRTSPINVEKCYGKHKVFSLCKICVLLDVKKFSDDAQKSFLVMLMFLHFCCSPCFAVSQAEFIRLFTVRLRGLFVWNVAWIFARLTNMLPWPQLCNDSVIYFYWDTYERNLNFLLPSGNSLCRSKSVFFCYSFVHK